MGDSEFDVNELVKEIGMSKTVRKCYDILKKNLVLL